MNKVELIKRIAESTGQTQKDVGVVLNTFQDVIKQAVNRGDKVALTGFLTFDKKHINGRTGVSNIGSVQKEWTSPAKDVITVKLAKGYKEL